MSTAEPLAPPDASARILDAAEACIRRYGIRRTSMAEVARTAGFSRAWLYRHFPDKESLVSAVLLRTDEAFWLAAREHIDAQPTLVAQVVEAVAFARAQAPSDLFLGLMETEPDTFWETPHYRGWPAVLVRYDSPSRERIETIIERGWWDRASKAQKQARGGERP